MLVDWELGSISETASAAITAFGAVFVLFEYFKRQREARLERGLALEARFDQDPLLSFAMLCLDWGSGSLPVPPDFADFVGRASVSHDPAKVYQALRPQLPLAVAENAELTLYRQAFVALFNHLEQTMALWRRELLDPADLPRTQWVAAELFEWTYRDRDIPSDQWFRSAIKFWYPAVDGLPTLDDLLDRFRSVLASSDGHHVSAMTM